MKVFQSASLLNSTSNQMFGNTAPSVQNVAGLVTLGQKVLSSDTNKEQFLSVLCDKIKRTVIRNLDSVLDFPKIFMDYESFFGVMQKISVAPFLSSDDNSWNVGADDYESTIWKISKPNITQTFFNNLSAFTIPITIPDVMLKSAFDEATMDEFITAIFNAIQSSLILLLNTSAHLAVCNLIGENVIRNKHVNLLALYNTATSNSLTASAALQNPDFLRYASMVMTNYIGYMSEASVLFNDGTIVRATQRDNMHVLMLNDFASAFNSVAQSSTFHNEFIELPFFDRITYWQNMGNSVPNFNLTSAVNIIPASQENSETPLTADIHGVVAVFADRQALGTTLMEDWTAADRNNRERYTNYTYGANRGYFNDLSENSVVFVISDPPTAARASRK